MSDTTTAIQFILERDWQPGSWPVITQTESRGVCTLGNVAARAAQDAALMARLSHVTYSRISVAHITGDKRSFFVVRP